MKSQQLILKYEYYVIFVIVYFQLLKNQFKAGKREFYWSTFFCLTNKDFRPQLKEKENKYLYCKIWQISCSRDEILTYNIRVGSGPR